MKIETVLKRLGSAGISPEQIAETKDHVLLKVPGVGKKTLVRLREKYGPVKPACLTLSEKVAEALFPVLLKMRGVGKGQVRAIARMVAAYFDD